LLWLQDQNEACKLDASVIATEGQPKKRLRQIISNGIGLLILGFLAWYLYKNQDVFQSLKNIRWQQIVWIALLDLAAFFVNTVMNYAMLKRLEPRISFRDCYALQYVNSMLNKILPTIGAGAAYRAVYLKQRYQFSYSHFVSALAGLYVVNFVATPLLAFLCMGIIYARSGIFNLGLILVFLAFLLPSLAIILFSPKLPDSNNRIIRTARSIIDDWNFIKKDIKLLLIAAFSFVALLLIIALQTMVSYQALGVHPQFIPMLLLSTTAIILQLLNFTPDAIGVKEGIFVFAGNLVQISNATLVLGSFVVRAVTMTTTLVLGGISHLALMHNLKEGDSHRPEGEINP